jgi:serine/threonine protein kinase
VLEAPLQVTEFMAGGSIRAALGDTLKAIDWLVRVRIARQIAEGMRHLHKLSIAHRDLKSDNVLLDGEFNAKVADFGTSRVLGAIRAPGVTAATGSGTASMTKAVGTQLWMAPELFFGHSKYGPEVDVYS